VKADYGNVDTARQVLEETSDLVRAGKLSVSVANAVAKLASVGLKASEVALGKRLGDVERELRDRSKAQFASSSHPVGRRRA
jgi:hypothetical protein